MTRTQRKVFEVLENCFVEMTETKRTVSSVIWSNKSSFLEDSFDEMTVTQRKASSALENSFVEMTETKRKVSSGMSETERKVSLALENSFVEMTETKRKVSSVLDDGFDDMTETQRKVSSALENSFVEMTETKRKVSAVLDDGYDEITETQRKVSSALENSFVEMTGRTRKVSSGMSKTQRKASAVLDDGYDGLVSSLQNLPIRSVSVNSPTKARSQANLKLFRKRFQRLRPHSLGNFVKNEIDEDEMVFHPDKPWLNALLDSPANRKHRNQKWKTCTCNSSKDELSFNPEQIKVGFY